MMPALAMAQEKLILDTDFNVLGDDGQVGIMAAQLDAEGVIDLLGITIVSGNQWHDQEMVEALKAVERMGIEDQVGVYRGSQYPLLHDYDTYPLERELFGYGYAGAWSNPKPEESDLVAPPDGFATHTEPASQHAVDFIIEQVKKYPGDVSILAIGPLTNVAIALRVAPEIVPLIKRIVYMGGACDVPGNVTPAAEFNWWFDPEAAKIVLREPIPQAVIPLDVTNTVLFNKDVYDRIVNEQVPSTPVTELHRWRFEDRFAQTPDYETNMWDTLAMAYLVDPTYATDVRELWVDMDDNFGPDYGRSLCYYRNPPKDALEKMNVVFGFDNDRFYDFYVDLVTRAVPVQPYDGEGANGDGVPAPANLTAKVYSGTAAELFWDRVSGVALNYEVIRDGAVVATIDGTSYFDDTLSRGAIYNYQVTAILDSMRSDPAAVDVSTER